MFTCSLLEKTLTDHKMRICFDPPLDCLLITAASQHLCGTCIRIYPSLTSTQYRSKNDETSPEDLNIQQERNGLILRRVVNSEYEENNITKIA